MTCGTAYHDGVEGWDMRHERRTAPYDADWPTRQGYELARRYADLDPLQGAEVLAAEIPWEMQLCTCCQRWVGKLDALARIEGKIWIVEHKSSGSWSNNHDYLRMVSPQAMMYMLAAYEGVIPGLTGIPEGVLYLTMVKSGTRRREATPLDKRYKKDGGLRANARERDETDDEYLTRWADAAKFHESPIRYTRRQIMAYKHSIIDWGHQMAAARKRPELPMAMGPACSDYGICAYLDVCAGNVSINDNAFYKDKERT